MSCCTDCLAKRKQEKLEFLSQELSKAVWKSDMKRVQQLIDSGATVEGIGPNDNTKSTPVLVAARNGCLQIMKVLIEADANITATDRNGNGVLIIVSTLGFIDMMQFIVTTYKGKPEFEKLSKDKNGKTAIHYAAGKGRDKAVKLLVEETDISVNSQDNFGYTPLHYAAMGGSLKAAQYLVEHAHARLSIKNTKGMTAAQVAEAERNNDIANYLNSVRQEDEKEDNNVAVVAPKDQNFPPAPSIIEAKEMVDAPPTSRRSSADEAPGSLDVAARFGRLSIRPSATFETTHAAPTSSLREEDIRQQMEEVRQV
eukprot:TRINITY_DN13025_c0_g1_i1.p1 TRINITY_DN13025_c0_g1~~TRINITY_DN13025_c0_g1_i1.p1  ORF type:complete len:312 (-),score=77.79 TRINITY_DN13025_c0_g1_i1:32-967(-)